MPHDIGLAGTSGAQIALKSVHIEGRIDGALATVAIKQRYHNDSGTKLEIVYTFPLAREATLLGMSVALGDRRLEAVVLGREQAGKQYEEGIDGGDVSILVERSASGLYTANLGNIENGEEVTLEFRYAQLLTIEENRLRLGVPCVIAPRYGDAHRDGGLAPHENVAAGFAAEYPLTVRIALPKEMGNASVHCPSHDFVVRTTEEGMAVVVESGAALDRDFVLIVENLTQRSFALLAPDPGGHMMLACFHPALPRTNPEPLCLKILVDCSGSMAGDSMAHKKQALLGLVRMLGDGDYVSFSRFGDRVKHETAQLSACSQQMRSRLVQVIQGMEADMGGKAMESALLSTLNDIAMPQGISASPCVLLITDGGVWNMDKIICAGQASDHRIFFIGMGSTPAESLMRESAEKTGGACELVSPNENIDAATGRMIGRMRGARTDPEYINWGMEPIWQSTLPLTLYDGDMMCAFALFAEAPARAPVLHWSMGDGEGQIAAEIVQRTDSDAVARLGGVRRMSEAATSAEAQALALAYQLISRYSSLFLVYTRDGIKSAGLPLLHQVPQMMAAGHGGLGSVKSDRRQGAVRVPAGSSYCRVPKLPGGLSQNCSQRFVSPGRAHRGSLDLEQVIPSFPRLLGMRVPSERAFSQGMPLRCLLAFERRVFMTSNYEKVFRLTAEDAMGSDIDYFINGIASRVQLPLEQVWAVLLDWLRIRFSDCLALSRYAQRLLRTRLRDIEKEKKADIFEALTKMFPRVTLDAW